MTSIRKRLTLLLLPVLLGACSEFNKALKSTDAGYKLEVAEKMMAKDMAARYQSWGELIAATNYSFLRGASHPAEMVWQAHALGMAGIGIADQLRPAFSEKLTQNHAQRLEACREVLRRGVPRHGLAQARARLAHRLVGLRVDIKSETQLAEEESGEAWAEGEWITDPAVLVVRDRLGADVALRERDYLNRQGYCTTARLHSDNARAAYIAKLRATVRQYAKNLKALGELANVSVDCPTPHLENDDLSLAQAGLEVRFDFDRKGAVGLNDGEASGGQQVMKSLILLIGLLMDESRPGGFVFIDEPFAHLDVANIDRVGTFLRATRAQYLITTPVTHNANVFAPAQLTLVTRKKQPGTDWAPPIGVLQRAVD